MDIALSIALRSSSSSANDAMYASNSFWSVSSASAVVWCLCSSLTSSSRYAGSREEAMSVALMRQSVTLGSPLLATPIALTIPNVFTPLLALSMSRSQQPEMRSAEPTHVPPNLCTSYPEPRSTPPDPAGAGAGSATASARTNLEAARACLALLDAARSARAPLAYARRAEAAPGTTVASAAADAAEAMLRSGA